MIVVLSGSWIGWVSIGSYASNTESAVEEQFLQYNFHYAIFHYESGKLDEKSFALYITHSQPEDSSVSSFVVVIIDVDVVCSTYYTCTCYK